jgi:hypothetical protein
MTAARQIPQEKGDAIEDDVKLIFGNIHDEDLNKNNLMKILKTFVVVKDNIEFNQGITLLAGVL